METLRKLTCVNIEMSLWEGRRKLTAEDLGLSADQIPPDEVASLGSKRVFPKEPLREFLAIRKRAERLCLEHGTRLMNGFVIPTEKRHALAAELDKLKDQFDASVNTLLTHYDQVLGDFLAKFPAWEAGIRKAMLTKEEARGRFKFRRVFFDVVVPPGMEDSSSLDEMLDGIAGQVLTETGLVATEVLESTLTPKKDSARQSTVKLLAEMQEKIISFAFVDRRLGAIAARIDLVLKSLPKTGMITGDDFVRFRKTFQVLADPAKSSAPENIPAAKIRQDAPAKPVKKAKEGSSSVHGESQDSVL